LRWGQLFEVIMSVPDTPVTILLADDNNSVRDMLKDMLESQGYQVICAENGNQALELLSCHPVDLVLLDVLMPQRSGLAVCRDIKSHAETRLIPVVLITGLASSGDRMEGIESGADDFIRKPVRKDELLARVRALVKLKRYTDELESAETVVCTLARSIEAKDPYTEGHCDRLAHYAVALAQELGLPEDQCIALRRAGIVHDIGKVAVPDHILLKPGPLTTEERNVMEMHPQVGERICAPLKSFRLVLPIIRHHHEKQDGSGYPDHLQGEHIPLGARILQTGDLYDALTTDRPYRAALAPRRAFQILHSECDRGWWDRRLLDCLESLIAAQPHLAGLCTV
jgi:putative two-component system response regulator